MPSSVYTTSVLLRGTHVDVLAVPLAPAKEQNNTYALNLGAVSKENCYAMYLPYAKQTEAALVQLRGNCSAARGQGRVLLRSPASIPRKGSVPQFVPIPL